MWLTDLFLFFYKRNLTQQAVQLSNNKKETKITQKIISKFKSQPKHIFSNNYKYLTYFHCCIIVLSKIIQVHINIVI